MLSHLRLQCKFANIRLFQRAFSPASTIALIGLCKPPALPVVMTSKYIYHKACLFNLLTVSESFTVISTHPGTKPLRNAFFTDLRFDHAQQ